MRKRERVALLSLSLWCLAIVNMLWLFLMVPKVGLQCVIEVFPDHTHLLFIVFYYWLSRQGVLEIKILTLAALVTLAFARHT